MDIIRDRGPISRLDVVDSGRRRRFSDGAKLAIVAESYRGSKQVSATARRHGITRFQLNSWRKAHREGRLGARSWDGFVPALVRRSANTNAAAHRQSRAQSFTTWAEVTGLAASF